MSEDQGKTENPTVADWATCPDCDLPLAGPALNHPRGGELPRRADCLICLGCGNHWIEDSALVVGMAWAMEYAESMS